MGDQRDAKPGAPADEELRLNSLFPAAATASVPEIVAGLGLWERSPSPSERPYVALNMISSADGRATVSGRSGPLSDTADRKLFHGLRTAVDAVLVGAHTVRVERYGRLIPAQERRELRRARGLEEEPLACVVSASLAFGPDIPLFSEPAARVAILTPSTASLPALPAQVEYVRAEVDGHLDLAAALAELKARFGVGSVLCEGGPHLACELVRAGLVDELFLSLSPTLAGGDPAAAPALRILSGVELDPPVKLELHGVLQSDSSLFLRYGVGA
jgi:riboflavin biosynthesis pyrimidine reductase